MREYVTDAIVLDREPSGERDFRVVLFTKLFGKIDARAKSARNITSKLSSHLNPGAVVRVRVVEKKNRHIVDAIREGTVVSSPTSLHRLLGLLPDEVPEIELWDMLLSGAPRWSDVLTALGWGPKSAECELCTSTDHLLFHPRTQKFFCINCASKLPLKEVLYIHESL
ncbi:MAG: recombination protein O N-terminal domain-containing protein [Patescibacteria group bacterium]